MSPPKLIKDKKDPLLIDGDDDVCVEIVKDKTVKQVTFVGEEQELPTTEEETPKKRAARKRAILMKKIIYTIVAFTVGGLCFWQIAVILGTVLGLREPNNAGQFEKEVSKEVSETEKLNKIANTFWSYTQYKNPDGKDLYRSSVRGFFIGLDKGKCLDILDDLEAIDQTYLNQLKQYDYAVLQFSLKSYIEGYEWIKFGNPNCINFFNDVLSPRYWNHQRETETGYALKYSIANSDEAVDEMIFLMEDLLKSMAEKRTNYNSSMVRVPDMIDAHLTRLHNTSRNLLSENILSSNYTDKYGNDRSMHYYLNRVGRGYRLKPIWALRALKELIIDKYIPAGRPSAGVNSYDRGDEYYAACLRHFVSKNVTVDEVRNTGIKEVARIKGLMEKIMNDEGFNGTLREYFTYLSTERVQDFYNRTEDELLSGFRTIINNRINPKLQEIFYEEHIPNQPIRVQAMEQDLLPSSYADSVFSPNLWRPETRPTFLMMAVALHESNPGHHLQATYNKKHFDLPYRHVEWPQEHHSGPSAVPAFTSYVEGWGSYAEYLGEEFGLYNSSKLELFGRHSEDMLRACRLVIDTGIHAFGMTRAEAIEYLQEHVAIPKEQIEIEVDRVITWPGQASSYKMGEMTILELRRKAERVLGELFDIKDFHKTVLDVGRVPLQMLEDEVRVWIWKTKPAQKKTRSWSSYMCDEYL